MAVKGTAANERNTHGFEISCRHNALVRVEWYFWRYISPVWRKLYGSSLPSQWHNASKRGSLNARYGSNAFQHTLEELCPLREVLVFRLSHSKIICKHVVRLKSQLDTLQIPQASYEEAGTNQKHQGKRHFANDEHIAKLLVSGTGVASRSFF